MTEEKMIADFIKDTMPADIPKIIIDVGANADAIFSAGFIRAGWKAILIEPQPACAESLRELYPEHIVIQKACHNKRSQDKLYLARGTDSQLATLNTNSDPWFDEVRGDDFLMVECDTLTNILDEQKVDAIGILKIDCESFDPQVIAGLDLKKYSPAFIVTEEYYWEPKNLQEKYSILEDHEYVLQGYVGYNSVWRKRDESIKFTNYLMREFYKTHGIYPRECGDLPLVGMFT